MTKTLDGKVALVTGASRGIGYGIARKLAELGAHVICVARTVGGLEDLDDEIKALGSSATLVPLDLKDFDGIDRMGKAIYDRWGKLDILVGNAGMLGVLTPVSHIEPKLWDEVMAVNVTANWRLIRSMDLLLRQSENGRAIFVSSRVTQKLSAYWGLYSTSKAALEALVTTYGKEVPDSVDISLVCPGPVATAMRAKAMPGEDAASLPKPADIAAALQPLFDGPAGGHRGIFDLTDGKLKARQV